MKLFLKFYRLIPKLKYIIDNAVTPELRQLRGKTLECVSLIGLAVGHDKVRKCNQSKYCDLIRVIFICHFLGIVCERRKRCDGYIIEKS